MNNASKKHRLNADKLLLITVSLFLFPALELKATNVLFHTGDSFFHSYLTQKIIDSTDHDSESLELNYTGSPVVPGNFCGYNGFDKLRILNLTPDFIQNVNRVYQSLRKQNPLIAEIRKEKDQFKVLSEYNPFHLFVYNRDVDWNKQKLALKYNENWQHIIEYDLKLVDQPGNKLQYSPFVKNLSGISEDLLNAEQFKPLNVNIPEHIKVLTMDRREEVLTVDTKYIQFVIVPVPVPPYFDSEENILEKYFEDSGLEFISITTDGIQIYHMSGNNVVSSPWKTIHDENGPFVNEYEYSYEELLEEKKDTVEYLKELELQIKAFNSPE